MGEPTIRPATAETHNRSLVIPAAVTFLLALFVVRFVVGESKRVSLADSG